MKQFLCTTCVYVSKCKSCGFRGFLWRNIWSAHGVQTVELNIFGYMSRRKISFKTFNANETNLSSGNDFALCIFFYSFHSFRHVKNKYFEWKISSNWNPCFNVHTVKYYNWFASYGCGLYRILPQIKCYLLAFQTLLQFVIVVEITS